MPALTTPEPYPRSRHTLEEMIDSVRGDLALRGSSFLTTAEITDWLNRAQDEFARETKWFKFSATMSTVAAQAQYAFPDAAAYQVLSIEAMRLDDRDLFPLTQHRLDRWGSEWRDQTGTPTHWMLTGGGMSSFRLFPTPSAASASGLDVYGTGLPPVVANDEDQFYIPNGYDTALLAYAKMQATLKDAHGEGSRRMGRYEAEWAAAVERGKKSVREANEWDQVFLGEDALTGGDTGPMLWRPGYTNIQAP